MELNAAHAHLVLNHAPIFAFSFGLLLLAWGRWRESDDVVRAVLALFLVAGLMSIAVFLSGENAEDVVDELAGISHDAIELHEEAGERAMIASIVVGVLAGIGLGRYWTKMIPRWVTGAAAAGGILALGFLSYAALQGGRINHPELRAVSIVSPVPERSSPPGRPAHPRTAGRASPFV